MGYWSIGDQQRCPDRQQDHPCLPTQSVWTNMVPKHCYLCQSGSMDGGGAQKLGLDSGYVDTWVGYGVLICEIWDIWYTVSSPLPGSDWFWPTTTFLVSIEFKSWVILWYRGSCGPKFVFSDLHHQGTFFDQTNCMVCRRVVKNDTKPKTLGILDC